MTKKSSGQMIYALRTALGKTQGEFAEAFGISQPVVSSWEQDRATPTPEAYMTMGNLAVEAGADPMWFWEQAGTDRRKMLVFAERLLKEMGKEPASGEIIEIPLLSMDEAERGREEKKRASGRVFRFQAGRVVNRVSTVALVVETESAVTPFAAGDIVVVDRSSINLQSLWKKVVLVHLDRSVSPASFGVREWPWGPCMGLLEFSELPQDRYLWGATLGPLGSFKHEAVVIGYEHSQARKQFSQDHLDWKVRGYKAGDPEPREEGLYEREREAAFKNIRPTDGCTVLGRMIAWFSADTEAKG